MPGFYLVLFDSSNKMSRIWLSEGNERTVMPLKVQVYSKRVAVDDLVVDQGLEECRVGISSNLREGKSYKSFSFLKIWRSSIGNKQRLIEFMLAQLNLEVIEISGEISIKI